jgi:hypothetical protein
LQDPSLTAAYYEVQGRIQRGERVYPDELEFVREVLRSIHRHEPELAEHIRETVLTPANRMQYDSWLEKGFPPTAFSLKQLLRAIFASAPLSRVMMRHNRALLRVYQQNGELKSNLAHRHVLPMRRIQYKAQEKQAYEALEDYAQDLAQQVTAANDQQTRVSTGFYLSFLRRRFASSLWAIAETLRRRRERVAATLEYLESGGSPAALTTGNVVEGEDDFELDDSDAEIIDQLLENRSEADLRWELERLGEMLGSSLYDAAPASSKMQALLGWLRAAARGPGSARPHPTDGDLQPVLGHGGRHRPALQTGEPELPDRDLFGPRRPVHRSRDRQAGRHRARGDQKALPARPDRQSIGNSTVPGRSYHFDLCHQDRKSDSKRPQNQGRERRRGHSEGTRIQYCARDRAQGAKPARGPRYGGRLDQVTGRVSPAHRLVELEVGFRLGNRIGQRE